jgi:phage-related protein
MANLWEIHFYPKADGSMPVREYIESLPEKEAQKVLAFINLLHEQGPYLRRPYADLLKDGIHELRIRISGTHERILYFFCHQNQIVLTNNFEKYTDKIPQSEIDLAKARRQDFLKRFPQKQEVYP